MNSIMETHYPILQEYQALRTQMMQLLGDEDLAYQTGGENLTLGALCREMGEVQMSYIQSFQTGHQDFSYRSEASGLENSVARLTAWFEELDGELRATIEGLSQEEIDNRVIDRGGGFVIPVDIQLRVYQEALLIFYGKASVYLKALGKARPQQWQDWIA